MARDEFRASLERTKDDLICGTDVRECLSHVVDALLRFSASDSVAPQIDLDPLRELRAWHHRQACRISDRQTMLDHDKAVRSLNAYFPANDQL